MNSKLYLESTGQSGLRFEDLRFNVSHSSGTAIFAIASGCEVGVDIECMSAGSDLEAIASTVFSAPEQRVLSRLDSRVRHITFFRFWTQKEAHIKADGRGMLLPLPSIDVSALDFPAHDLPVAPHRDSLWDGSSGEWREDTRWELQAKDGSDN